MKCTCGCGRDRESGSRHNYTAAFDSLPNIVILATLPVTSEPGVARTYRGPCDYMESMPQTTPSLGSIERNLACGTVRI